MNQVCYRHPDRPTALSCTRCGRSACPECLRPASVGQHCVTCVNDATASARVATPVPTTSTAARPYVTYSLIAINLLVFAAMVLQAHGTEIWTSLIYQRGVLVTGSSEYVDQYWRLLTSGFLHQNVAHVVLNMVSLYIIGRDLEHAFGWSRYLAVYLVSLIGGSAAVMALEHSPTATAGASGAIYGLMGALLVVLLRLKAPIGTVVAVIAVNVVISISIPGISLYGHLGGLVFGAAAAAAVVWLPAKVLAPQKRTHAAVSRVGWIGIAALAVLALAIGTGFAAVA